ncbi:unnamed protein product, partial [Trichogramma brassicae]
ELQLICEHGFGHCLHCYCRRPTSVATLDGPKPLAQPPHGPELRPLIESGTTAALALLLRATPSSSVLRGSHWHRARRCSTTTIAPGTSCLRRQDRDRRHGVSGSSTTTPSSASHLDVQQFQARGGRGERRRGAPPSDTPCPIGASSSESRRGSRRTARADDLGAPQAPGKEEKKETVRRIKIEYTGKRALKEQQQHAEEEEEKQQTEQDDDEISNRHRGAGARLGSFQHDRVFCWHKGRSGMASSSNSARRWRQQMKKKLIFLVRESPCVWARNGESKEGQIKAWRSVASSLSTVNRQITVTEAHEKWRSLLKEYREQADIKKCFEEGPEGFPWTPLWPYFEAMSFVETTNEEDTLSISSIENFPDVGEIFGLFGKDEDSLDSFPDFGALVAAPSSVDVVEPEVIDIDDDPVELEIIVLDDDDADIIVID